MTWKNFMNHESRKNLGIMLRGKDDSQVLHMNGSMENNLNKL